MEKLIRRPVLISMLFIGLTLMGYFSYRHLPMELYPNAEFPELNVVVSARGELDPTYIESQAVVPVEGVIGTLEGVEKIETRVSARNARIKVTFTRHTNIKYAYLKLEEKVRAVSRNIPEEFTVQVNRAATGMVNSQFMSLLVLGDEDVDYIRNITDTDVVAALENVEGVAGITVLGGRQKTIELVVDEDKCKALNISRSRIGSLIAGNMAEKSFAGSAYDAGNKRYFVNVTAEYLKIEDLGNIVVADGPVFLKDIAEIRFGIKEEESYSRVNGKEVINCIVSKSSQENVIELSERMRAEIGRLNAELARKNISVKIDTDVAETMKGNIDTIINLGITGALLAIFILYLFLRNFRIVAIVAFAIPISVFSGFYFFYWFDISINTLTLTGIALAVGMLLDNSVVVMENIFRQRAMGMGVGESAVQGTREVWKSVFAATLTTITVFLPFLFAENVFIRLIGKHIGFSIITTLSVSLIVALLLVPMAVYFFMNRNRSGRVNFGVLSIYSRPVQAYIALLKMCLRKPAQVVAISLLLLAVAVILSLTLTVNTLQEVDTDRFDVYVVSPTGYTLAHTDEMIRRYEEVLLETDEIEQVNTRVYATEANMVIKLKKDFEKLNRTTLQELKNKVLNQAKSLQIWNVSLEARSNSENFQGGGGDALTGGGTELLRMLGLGTQTEKILIKGQDFEQMENLAGYLTYQMQGMENVNSVWLNTSGGQPEARLEFDQYLMGMYELTPADVVNELNNFVPENVTQVRYKAGDEEYDIIIRDRKYERTDEKGEKRERNLEDLRNLRVSNAKYTLTELRNFSRINLTRGKGEINRVNRDKEIVVSYRFHADVNESKELLDAARMEIDEFVQAVDLPSGIAVEVIHEENNMAEFTFLILAAVVIIFMILASVFESLLAPVVLMFAIPLAAIGSLFAILLTGNSILNANVLTGFIILIGIVVNNSIILIDYTSLLRRRGYRKQRALLVAGISRLRPILITAITTIVAMLPLALGRGEFVAGLGAPFAITVIGGLAMSTLLTLVIIPTLYSGLENALSRLRSQPLWVKVLQLLACVAAVVAILFLTDSILWRLAYLVVTIILIPAVSWFIENSLRRASQRIISPEAEITIQVRNLVKIYGRPPLFLREWESGRRLREGLGLKENYHSLKDLWPLLWLLPLQVFVFYFSYVYLASAFWMLFFALVAWLLLLKIMDIPGQYWEYRQSGGLLRLHGIFRFAVYYLLPLASLCLAQVKFGEPGITLLWGLLWYAGIWIHTLAVKIGKQDIRPEVIEAHFRGAKKFLYRLVFKVPLIGYRKEPFRALNAVSMDIHTGVFGLLGPNGAGKTTLMRIICGVFEQSYGKIFINGIDTQEKREELQGLIGYLPQEFGMYENLTAHQFLDYQALLKGIYAKEKRNARIREVLDAVHMYEYRDKKIAGFSGGMKQRIGIAQTLLHLPRILVVDEPTAGLDPRERIRFRNLLVELSRNRIVIFSTHIIEDIASSSNQVAVISKGSLKYQGTPLEMAGMAEGVTWMFDIPAEEFECLPADLLVVHHIRMDDIIRVRCLSETCPVPGALAVRPVLEDAYIWLLQGRTSIHNL